MRILRLVTLFQFGLWIVGVTPIEASGYEVMCVSVCVGGRIIPHPVDI